MYDYSEFLKDLDFSPSFKDAERRAASFLLALSYVAQDLITAEHNTILYENLVDVTFSELMSRVPTDSMKSADARKSWVQRQKEYTESIEKYAKAKSKSDYLKRLNSLFTEAHTYNRQKARTDA